MDNDNDNTDNNVYDNTNDDINMITDIMRICNILCSDNHLEGTALAAVLDEFASIPDRYY